MQSLFPANPSAVPTTTQDETHLFWPAIKDKLRNTLSSQEFDTWIAPLKVRMEDKGEMVIVLPNLVFYQGLRGEYLERIEAAKTAVGLGALNIRFEMEGSQQVPELAEIDGMRHQTGVPPTRAPQRKALADENLTPSANVGADNPADAQYTSEEFSDESFANQSYSDEPSPEPVAAPVGDHSPNSRQAFSRSLSQDGSLIRTYTFESFVKGDSNQFAVATCLSSAENPGRAYNPLFIYGSTGLGKTHLLHAVGNRVLNINPDAVVTYISSERFMNEMIYCIRFNKMWDFRQKYRNCDVFLVDDIQFISGKKSTQEEFFHTFNTLYAAKKQIVITSDLFPKDIPDIEDRLRNRFQWGLIADIQPPSIEHRIAILMSKAEKLGIRLRDDVAEYIARHAKRNVRILEGALHRINAFARLQGEDISMDLAVRTFKDVLGEPPKRMTVEIVQKAVADHFKLRVADLKSKRRQRAFAHPRQIAMYLSRKLTGSSFPEIGEKFGGKDHTTVMHNVKKIERCLEKDLDLKAHVEALERLLEQQQ